MGGTRVSIKGGGFNVNFFTAGNYVYIGSDATTWVPCDVIEGACSVQCGSANTLICDTGMWNVRTPLVDSGWLDVKVLIESFQNGANDMITTVLPKAFYYHNMAYQYNPLIRGVSPRATSAEETITITGNNLGYWMQDYRVVYVGAGRAPQGGNVNNGDVSTTTLTMQAMCRPGQLNTVHNPDEPDLPATTSAIVMQEDRNPDPIVEDVFKCALADFSAGSYNVSVYMSNSQRAGGNKDSSVFIPGLAVVYDTDGYYEESLLSRDSAGTLHMVQYYPRIDSIFPSAGSLAGGTVVSITGGGFEMNKTAVSVLIGGRTCEITYSSIELIICNTTADHNETVPTKVSVGSYGASKVPNERMKLLETVGNWISVSSTSALSGSFSAWSPEFGSSGPAWITYSTSVSVSGTYELLLGVPAADSKCTPRSTSVPVVVRSGSGYSLVHVDLSETSSSYKSLGTAVILENATTTVSSVHV
jgi:hypothetical protein